MGNKPKFRSAYCFKAEEDLPFRLTSPTGGPMQNEYGYEIDKYGMKILIKTGETNLYERIQESLEETKIENILKRVAIGDTSVMRPDGIYADMTEMPNNLIEARQSMQNLENLWGNLDNEIKRKYDFSVEKFIGASGTESWLKDMGIIKENPIKEAAETKTEGEVNE